MKVLVVNNVAPFVWGGAEALADNLVDNLQRHGHRSELLRIPFQWEPHSIIPSQMLLARWLELREADRIIALKFPAYLARHEHKTLWVLHQYRQAYDLFESGRSTIPNSPEGDELRAMIAVADGEAFAESKAIFVNSPVTQDRMMRFNSVEPQVLLPPVNDPDRFVGGDHGDYIFAGGRVNAMKRQALMVEAAALSPGIRLVIAGPPDSDRDRVELEQLVERLGLGDRVHLDIRLLERNEYAAYVNGASAVSYMPFDEDSLGYVAMEAATAVKPIITTTDSGGILGLVRHGETGWAAEPTAEAVADAFGAVDAHRSIRDVGQAAHELWSSMDVTWVATIGRLIG